MFQASVAFAGCVEKEHVSVEIGRQAEQVHVRCTNRLDIVAEPRHVGGLPPAYRDRMRHATHREFTNTEFGYLDRMVDEFGVVGGLVLAKAVHGRAIALHRGRHAPALAYRFRRFLYTHAALTILLPNDFEEYTGAVEEGV